MLFAVPSARVLEASAGAPDLMLLQTLTYLATQASLQRERGSAAHMHGGQEAETKGRAKTTFR